MSTETARKPENGKGIAERACRECSRRKSKCDRLLPLCSPCQQHTRVCNYEKPGKTPLTRKHLTQVEEELARTKALLKSFRPQRREAGEEDVPYSPTQYHAILSQDGSPSRGQPNAAHHVRKPSSNYSAVVLAPHSSYTPGNTVPEVLQHFDTPGHNDGGGSAQLTSNNMKNTPNTDTMSRSNWSNVLSMESPPTSGNFEWDERSGKPGGERFVDGMGSLTSDLNGSGYMGVASGAALLRITAGNSESHSGTTSPRAPSIPFALTSLSFLDGFIDEYFSLYHRSYPIVHEATFRAQFMEVIPRPSGNAWQVLMYAVAALGAWSTSTQRSEIHTALFEAAKIRFSIDLLETGNLVLVQALTLMSNYAQMGNKPNSSYNYYGLARRIAMGIGLHKEFPTWQSRPLVLEIRRRVWWCLYAFDVGSMITFSRPFDFPQSGIEVQLPADVHDSDLTSSTNERPQPRAETTLYTHLRAQCSFHMATSHIYSRLISAPFPPAKDMIQLDDQSIEPWLASLPHHFQQSATQPPKYALCHAALQWRYRNFRILMYRPFLVRRAMSGPEWGQEENTTPEDMENMDVAYHRCLETSKESVELISNFWFTNQQTMMASWYGLYFLFQAILIPIVCLRNNPHSEIASEWREQVLEAIRILESMIELNPTANRCLRVVRSLTQAYIAADEGMDGPTQESLEDQLNGLYPMMWPALGSDFAQFDSTDALQESTIMDFMNQMSGFE